MGLSPHPHYNFQFTTSGSGIIIMDKIRSALVKIIDIFLTIIIFYKRTIATHIAQRSRKAQTPKDSRSRYNLRDQTQDSKRWLKLLPVVHHLHTLTDSTAVLHECLTVRLTRRATVYWTELESFADWEVTTSCNRTSLPLYQVCLIARSYRLAQ